MRSLHSHAGFSIHASREAQLEQPARLGGSAKIPHVPGEDGEERHHLIRPEPHEREGYVPNVVYTCGALRHGPLLILPYAVSDTYTNFANIPIAAVLEAMMG